jgi:hypothetical protein
MQGVKDGNAVVAGDHRLAIQDERLGAQLGGGRGDGGISIGPVIAAAGEQANGVRRIAMSETVEGRQLGFHGGAQMGLSLAFDAILRLVVGRRHELCDLVHTSSD